MTDRDWITAIVLVILALLFGPQCKAWWEQEHPRRRVRRMMKESRKRRR